MAYRGVHTLALHFTGSATLPNIYLTSFYVYRSFTRPSTMLAMIEGLETRLYSLSVHLRVDNLYWVDKFHVYMWFHSAIWLVSPDLGTGSQQLLLWMIPGSLLRFFFFGETENGTTPHPPPSRFLPFPSSPSPHNFPFLLPTSPFPLPSHPLPLSPFTCCSTSFKLSLCTCVSSWSLSHSFIFKLSLCTCVSSWSLSHSFIFKLSLCTRVSSWSLS